MAPAASEDWKEQATKKAGTVTPAAPEWKTEIEEALSSLGFCRARCSEMLQAARRGHATGGVELRFLEFMEGELSFIFVHLNKALGSQHVDYAETMVSWLEELTRFGRTVVSAALKQANPQRQNTLLARVIQCFHRRHRYSYLFPYHVLRVVQDFYGLAEHSYWYGLHPAVGLDWLGPSTHPRFGDFPYGSHLVMMCMVMFSYGYKFEKDRFVQKLLCEAMPLDEAGRHFDDLVGRNIITQVAENSRRSNADEAERWQWNVNQRQHQLFASKSAEMDLIYTSDTLNLLAAASATDDHGNEASRTPRRLSLHHDDPDIPSLLKNIDLSQTRSLAVSGVVSRSVPLHRFLNLVDLDVEGWENFGDEDLLRICTSKMFFLVYLSIRSTRVSKLPPEINELYSLQILDASYTQVTEVPFGDFKARKLHRLDLRGTPIRQLIPQQILGLRHCLVALLLDEGMINSTETATSLPHDIQHFRRLETLATVDLSEQPASFINALGELSRLRVLAITWSFHQSSDRDYCEALLSSIKKWEGLESLSIHCGLGCSMEFLGSLSGPPLYLAKFKVIAGRFVVVPQWFFKWHRYLSFVQITVCKLEPHDLEILRDLAELKCLVLGLDFIPGEAIVIKHGGFYNLERFSIECSVPWLTFESGAMPKLTYLQLEFHACPTSPASVPMGIGNLCSLEKVALWYNVRYANSSSVKRTVKAVREQVPMCCKAVSVFINTPSIEQDDVQAVDEETESATRAPSGTGAGAQEDAHEVDEITEA